MPSVALPSFTVTGVSATAVLALIVACRPFLMTLATFLLRTVTVADGRACGVPTGD